MNRNSKIILTFLALLISGLVFLNYSEQELVKAAADNHEGKKCYPYCK